MKSRRFRRIGKFRERDRGLDGEAETAVATHSGQRSTPIADPNLALTAGSFDAIFALDVLEFRRASLGKVGTRPE
jgi:hypothetical protein